jgi:CDP-Glycerol:Poly(glycerophosphate) glycerophosphotransferase
MLSIFSPNTALRQKFRIVKRHVKITVFSARQWALLRQKANLSTLKVAFVVLTESTWKLEPLLRRMEGDTAFGTAVVVTPMLSLDEAARRIEQEGTRAYFEDREGDSPVLTTPEELDAFDPDIVFLTNPHQLSHPAFYNGLFERKLCCYAPYTHGVDQYGGNQAQYNQLFHNAMWCIFAPHDVAERLFQSVAIRHGKNVVVTGYPACEPLLDPASTGTGAWKAQDREKLKIIWAPHHTIDMPQLPYANFLRYADQFTAMAERCCDDVQWAFKPHPLLKSKLYKHPDWGRQRTDDFYEYWKSADHCQLEEGGYVDLFRQSDAMIHDSGSFLAEYLYLNKPVMFMQGVDNIRDFFNDFGVDAFEACKHARCFAQVEDFVSDLCGGQMPEGPERAAFFRKNIEPYFNTPPSEKIVKHLKNVFPKLGSDSTSAGGQRK